MGIILKPLISLIKLLIPLFVILYVLQAVFIIDIPDMDLLKENNPRITSFMRHDKNGNEEHTNTITFVPMREISPHIVRAVLSSEDDLFFVHDGFNWKELYSALKKNLKTKSYARGASTITQQLARNLFLSRDKSIFRKLREWYLTWQIETTLSKKRILELYLNIAEFGPGIYGVQAGCQYHFHKKPGQVTPDQAALLAAVLPKPASLGKKPYPKTTYTRLNRILNKQYVYDLHLPTDLFEK